MNLTWPWDSMIYSPFPWLHLWEGIWRSKFWYKNLCLYKTEVEFDISGFSIKSSRKKFFTQGEIQSQTAYFCQHY